MELVKKSLTTRIKNLLTKIDDDNLFLLSSSVSYYSALGLAPFLLIVLAVTTFVGADMQHQIVYQASAIFSPQVGEMISLIFNNAKEGINIGSISGALGAIILLFTASMVFIQFRYAFDVIYGFWNPDKRKSTLETIFERLFAMVTVVGGATVLIVSFSLAAIVEYFFGPGTDKSAMTKITLTVVNFLLYILMFTGVHYFTPSKKPRIRHALKMSVMSSIFFIIGNLLLASYLKSVAASSVYGAAGTLLIFLIWAFYSSFTLFLSVEVFVFLRKIGKIK